MSGKSSFTDLLNKAPTNIGGRPQRTAFDSMRTRAWVKAVMRRAGVTKPGSLTRVLFRHEVSTEHFQWNQYLSPGKVPDATRRSLVERNAVTRGAIRTFEIGPEEAGGNVPLWRLFDDEEDFAARTDEALDDLGTFQVGVPRASQVIALFTAPASNGNDALQAAQGNPDAGPPPFIFTIRKFAVAFAMWRCAMQTGEHVETFEYLMTALLSSQAGAIVLGEHAIYRDVCLFARALGVRYYVLRNDLDAARAVFSTLPIT